ncbi:MAG: cobalamin-dependent protein [Anaerolineales bacterium]|nr:cobalamin-dependent protein [Anaerolineales bacterium]
MSKDDIIEKLKRAMVDLEDEEVSKLLEEGIDSGVAPMDMIGKGLSLGINIVGERVKKKERPVSDMVIASEIMNDAMGKLCLLMESGGKSTGDTMVIGNVKGERHNIQGKRIVAATFAGAGYEVVDIGENASAGEFVKAAIEFEATVVGASAIGSLKPECKLINDALIDAGIRDNVIYIIGGWGITQEWCDSVGADAFGDNALDALVKVRALLCGDLPRRRDRVNK